MKHLNDYKKFFESHEDDDILEVEVELGGGDTKKLKIRECFDWDEIKDGTRGIITLINGQQMLVTIHEAGYEGVVFSINNVDRKYHYEEEQVRKIYVEVE